MPFSRHRISAFLPVYQCNGTNVSAPSSLMLTWFAYTPSVVDSGAAPARLGDGLAAGDVEADDAALTVAWVGLGLAGSALAWSDAGGTGVAACSVAGPAHPASSS